MKLFESKFKELKTSLENDDVENIKEIMRLSTFNRSFFDKN